MNQPQSRLQQNTVPEEPNLDLSHLSAEERSLIQNVMAKAKDMDSSKSYSNVSSSPTRLPSFQMYDQSSSFSNRWEKENFGEKSQQYMSDNSRKPEDTSLSEYSTSRERYKNELDSKLASEKRILKPDPKSELIEEEEEEEVSTLERKKVLLTRGILDSEAHSSNFTQRQVLIFNQLLPINTSILAKLNLKKSRLNYLSM
uniref:Uncharacterized protein n=1 Tax=Cacopsylla melanoneura TaxID=428564 RepID=A0A8D8YHR6_9HEMI